MDNKADIRQQKTTAFDGYDKTQTGLEKPLQ